MRAVKEVVIGPDEPVYTSGVVSRILEIPVWVLKQLDRENVVRPPRKKGRAARLYSRRELNKLQHVWYYMRVRRVNVQGVKILLEIEAGHVQR